MFEYISSSIEDTNSFAAEIVKKLPLGSVILLKGDLGAGKTAFVRGVASCLGIKEKVLSPTFNIMKVYYNDIPLIHIDAYRLEDVNSNIGLDEYIGYQTGLTFIEWPQYISDLLPKDSVSITITNLGDTKRKFVVEGLEK